ncbi:uncharacterized protein FSUBG_9151 [Fusarium subglutinans]|uniref:Uncharacterized protein n=1 Tax=Gibberella subglutinans TaxID=42677 RepID=A0A8H5PF07_GIBSU|nr:uncharacterized protein FSUBG_9151 [Fusarium subglutinans]KAF5595464.1 hypothetical protein FSUBG_9151 [Fusarium subglutinans]
MAPVRRYLRISKYSVLECRIYLDNPALAQSWLLNPRNPVLPKVIEAIRPLVLPKLREEKERIRKKSKKKSIKDVIVSDEFEVSIFLTETSTRHSLLYKTKHFRDKLPSKLESNSSKLIGETDSVPVDVEDEYRAPVLQEEDDDEVRLADIPVAETTTRRSKRQRGIQGPEQDGNDEAFEDDETASAIEIDSDTEAPPHKRHRARTNDGLDGNEDKKKLAMDVSYEGFAIYGQVLCLVVKKRATAAAGSGGGGKARPEGQATMENWISSTQVPVGEDIP